MAWSSRTATMKSRTRLRHEPGGVHHKGAEAVPAVDESAADRRKVFRVVRSKRTTNVLKHNHGSLPLFVGERVTFNGRRTSDGAMLWASGPDGGLNYRVDVTLAA